MSKNFKSRFFEDYILGETIKHSVPRTVTSGDVSLYLATTGSRFAINYSDEFSRDLGFQGTLVDDILVFHLVFGRTVPDLSLNAIANLGYADVRFLNPVYIGDTINSISKIVGLKENSNGKTGTVYVYSEGRNQKGELILSYYRWLMMRKRDFNEHLDKKTIPEMPTIVEKKDMKFFKNINLKKWNTSFTGSENLFEDYNVGEEIDHLDGQTIEESEHQMATRLYQNNARVHFNQHVEKEGRFGKRIIYGGYIISLARAISCNGLSNTIKLAAIHSGKHSSPTFSGDTIYAWSKILEKEDYNRDVGIMRIRTLASKNNNKISFPDEKSLTENIVLDLNYSVFIPKRI